MDSQFAEALLLAAGPAPAFSRILLVDDEPVVLRVTTSILRRAGFAVMPVGSGEEAIDLLKTGSFDLIVTDFHMGGKSGADVAIAARRDCPETPVVVMTGLIHAVPDWMCRGEQALPIVRKPFLMGELLQVVRKALPVRASALDAEARAVPA